MHLQTGSKPCPRRSDCGNRSSQNIATQLLCSRRRHPVKDRVWIASMVRCQVVSCDEKGTRPSFLFRTRSYFTSGKHDRVNDVPPTTTSASHTKTMSNSTSRTPSAPHTSNMSNTRLSTVPTSATKARQLSHLHAQLAQLTAHMSDLENLLRMTAVQAEGMRGLGGYAGGM